jgi:hypothetical protein
LINAALLQAKLCRPARRRRRSHCSKWARVPARASDATRLAAVDDQRHLDDFLADAELRSRLWFFAIVGPPSIVSWWVALVLGGRDALGLSVREQIVVDLVLLAAAMSGRTDFRAYSKEDDDEDENELRVDCRRSIARRRRLRARSQGRPSGGPGAGDRAAADADRRSGFAAR